jgi:hypothetical protein
LPVVVKVTVPALRAAPPAVRVRVSVPLVRYTMTGVRKFTGWLFS